MRNALSVLFVFAICIGYINAQQAVIVSVRAYFDRLVGGTNLTACRPTADKAFGGPQDQPTCTSLQYPVPPGAQGRWGVPASGNGKSGLGFEGRLDQNVQINQPFYLGYLNHFNFPIYNAASSCYLNLIFTVKNLQGVAIAQNIFSYQFNIDETTNRPPCPYPGTKNCSDRIDFASAFDSSQSFSIGQVNYTLRLDGFRESNISSSSSVNFFISNEEQTSTAFLFGAITFACPVCRGNVSYTVTSDNQCVCNCSSVQCPSGQVPGADCACACPNLNICGTGVLRTNCTCDCPNCTAPKVHLSQYDCSCDCPPNYCNGNPINTNTCACTCPPTCPIPNEIRDARCNCYCPNNTCPTPKIEDPNPNVCNCICPGTCGEGYTQNTNDCSCTCTRTCPNGQQLNTTTCACAACVGNWTKSNVTGLCTVCGLTSCPSNAESVDPTTCTCQCTSLRCDLYFNSSVVDLDNYCACRPCRAGECVCGNGIVEPGEECDSGNFTFNPCCVNCRYTRDPCDDGNPCTSFDFCNGTGSCFGTYKCPQSTECVSVYCNATGTCVEEFLPENTPCGSGNFCDERCATDTDPQNPFGYGCVATPWVCTDNYTLDCLYPECDNDAQGCVFRSSNGTSCTDSNDCTLNDMCVEGVCNGTRRSCPEDTNECTLAVCNPVGGCGFQLLNNVPCNADNNLCTVDDTCFGGVCRAGRNVICTTAEQCKSTSCNSSTGLCEYFNREENSTCDDTNVCTKDDRCINGTCIGDIDESLLESPPCGNPPLPSVSPADPTNLVVIFVVTGAAALIGAIAGLAVLLKKIRDSRLLDPDTWNPDTFSSVGANPLYQGSSKVVDNRLYNDG